MPEDTVVPVGGAEYGAVRTPINHSAVDAYLEKHIPGYKGPSEIHQFSFGQSNPTYLLTINTTNPPTKYVLRRKPLGPLVSKTAHAIEREFRVIDAVGKSGKVPVPKVYALCMDDSITGSGFYVMEYLQGRIFTDVLMPEISTKEERTQCWMSIIKTLGALHSLNPSEIGLGDYGSTKPFYPRQIRSLGKTSKAQAAVRDQKTDEAVGDIPDFDFLLEWYGKHCPSEAGGKETTIVHGDFKCDNMVSRNASPYPFLSTLLCVERGKQNVLGKGEKLWTEHWEGRAPTEVGRNEIANTKLCGDQQIFHPTKPEVIGVLDWELSTLGHPLSDLANLLQPFYIPDTGAKVKGSHLVPLRYVTRYLKSLKDLLADVADTHTATLPHRGIPESELPIPGADTLIKAYCKETGRPFPLAKWNAVVSFAFFRLAVIMQGIAARSAKGQASSQNAKIYGKLFPLLGMLAMDSTGQAGSKL